MARFDAGDGRGGTTPEPDLGEPDEPEASADSPFRVNGGRDRSSAPVTQAPVRDHDAEPTPPDITGPEPTPEPVPEPTEPDHGAEFDPGVDVDPAPVPEEPEPELVPEPAPPEPEPEAPVTPEPDPDDTPVSTLPIDRPDIQPPPEPGLVGRPSPGEVPVPEQGEIERGVSRRVARDLREQVAGGLAGVEPEHVDVFERDGQIHARPTASAMEFAQLHHAAETFETPEGVDVEIGPGAFEVVGDEVRLRDDFHEFISRQHAAHQFEQPEGVDVDVGPGAFVVRDGQVHLRDDFAEFFALASAAAEFEDFGIGDLEIIREDGQLVTRVTEDALRRHAAEQHPLLGARDFHVTEEDGQLVVEADEDRLHTAIQRHAATADPRFTPDDFDIIETDDGLTPMVQGDALLRVAAASDERFDEDDFDIIETDEGRFATVTDDAASEFVRSEAAAGFDILGPEHFDAVQTEDGWMADLTHEGHVLLTTEQLTADDRWRVPRPDSQFGPVFDPGRTAGPPPDMSEIVAMTPGVSMFQADTGETPTFDPGGRIPVAETALTPESRLESEREAELERQVIEDLEAEFGIGFTEDDFTLEEAITADQGRQLLSGAADPADITPAGVRISLTPEAEARITVAELGDDIREELTAEAEGTIFDFDDPAIVGDTGPGALVGTVPTVERHIGEIDVRAEDGDIIADVTRAGRDHTRTFVIDVFRGGEVDAQRDDHPGALPTHTHDAVRSRLLGADEWWRQTLTPAADTVLPSDTAEGLVSFTSPAGIGLLGTRIGDAVVEGVGAGVVDAAERGVQQVDPSLAESFDSILGDSRPDADRVGHAFADTVGGGVQTALERPLFAVGAGAGMVLGPTAAVRGGRAARRGVDRVRQADIRGRLDTIDARIRQDVLGQQRQGLAELPDTTRPTDVVDVVGPGRQDLATFSPEQIGARRRPEVHDPFATEPRSQRVIDTGETSVHVPETSFGRFLAEDRAQATLAPELSPQRARETAQRGIDGTREMLAGGPRDLLSQQLQADLLAQRRAMSPEVSATQPLSGLDRGGVRIWEDPSVTRQRAAEPGVRTGFAGPAVREPTQAELLGLTTEQTFGTGPIDDPFLRDLDRRRRRRDTGFGLADPTMGDLVGGAIAMDTGQRVGLFDPRPTTEPGTAFEGFAGLTPRERVGDTMREEAFTQPSERFATDELLLGDTIRSQPTRPRPGERIRGRPRHTFHPRIRTPPRRVPATRTPGRPPTIRAPRVPLIQQGDRDDRRRRRRGLGDDLDEIWLADVDDPLAGILGQREDRDDADLLGAAASDVDDLTGSAADDTDDLLGAFGGGRDTDGRAGGLL